MKRLLLGLIRVYQKGMLSFVAPLLPFCPNLLSIRGRGH